LEGSSLTIDGVDWKLVSEKLGFGIEIWGVAGSSPSEWEVLHRRSIRSKWTFIGVSPYDLNEHFFCDFRADIVPIVETIRDLWEVKSEWAFRRRVLRQYPLMLVRKAFPTAGRSDGVMSGVRDKLKSMLGGLSNIELILARGSRHREHRPWKKN